MIIPQSRYWWVCLKSQFYFHHRGQEKTNILFVRRNLVWSVSLVFLFGDFWSFSVREVLNRRLSQIIWPTGQNGECPS